MLRSVRFKAAVTAASPANGANGATPAQLMDVSSGLQVFCRGAGIEADQLPADAQTRLLHLAGQLFREALVGFRDLERSRNESRNRYPHRGTAAGPGRSATLVVTADGLRAAPGADALA